MPAPGICKLAGQIRAGEVSTHGQLGVPASCLPAVAVHTHYTPAAWLQVGADPRAGSWGVRCCTAAHAAGAARPCMAAVACRSPAVASVQESCRRVASVPAGLVAAEGTPAGRRVVADGCTQQSCLVLNQPAPGSWAAGVQEQLHKVVEGRSVPVHNPAGGYHQVGVAFCAATALSVCCAS